MHYSFVMINSRGLSIDLENPQEVEAAIKKLKKDGVDFIKTCTPGSNLSLIENPTEVRDY